MKNKIKYTDEPMEGLKVIKDFLPSPDQLVLKEGNENIITSSSMDNIKLVRSIE